MHNHAMKIEWVCAFVYVCEGDVCLCSFVKNMWFVSSEFGVTCLLFESQPSAGFSHLRVNENNTKFYSIFPKTIEYNPTFFCNPPVSIVLQIKHMIDKFNCMPSHSRAASQLGNRTSHCDKIMFEKLHDSSYFIKAARAHATNCTLMTANILH